MPDLFFLGFIGWAGPFGIWKLLAEHQLALVKWKNCNLFDAFWAHACDYKPSLLGSSFSWCPPKVISIFSSTLLEDFKGKSKAQWWEAGTAERRACRAKPYPLAQVRTSKSGGFPCTVKFPFSATAWYCISGLIERIPATEHVCVIFSLNAF